MKLSDALVLSIHILGNNPQQAIMLWGPPGCGKSYFAMRSLPEALGIPDEARFMFRPSNHDPVDMSGLPWTDGNTTRWITPDFLKRINAAAEKHGKALFAIDEFNQSVPMMFNALNGIILDRVLGDFELDPRVILVATGNRQTDKAASNRMPSHTANRLFHIDVESDIDGFTDYGIDAGLPSWLLSFLRFKPDLLNAFDPDKRENPTERVWEMFAKAAGHNPPKSMVAKLAQGFVGEGPAVTLAAFYNIMDEMPNPDAVLMDPANAPVPERLDVRFALCGAIAERATKLNFERVAQYADRLPKEFSVMLVRDSVRRHKELTSTSAFIKWSADNAGVF